MRNKNKNIMLDLEKITLNVREIALRAGAFLRNERSGFDRSKVEKKNAHDYVSYVDKESERRIVAQLRELLPEAGFIAEEGSGSLTTENYCWLVDPLDGTTNFIHNNAPYCVSIALRNKEELLVGVVYEVCRDELYWTYKGAPSYLNNKEIHVSDVSDMDEAFVALGFPYDSQKYKPLAEHIVHELYGNVGGMRLQGAAAAELCYVAAGRFEARIEGLLGPWDIAAGSIILMNAGGKVTDYSGGGDFYSGREAQKEFEELLTAIIARISLFDESIVGIQAKDCTYRIYRDTRFSSDKTPYKIHLGGYINARGKKSEHCGYYVHIEPDNCMLAGVSRCLEPKVLKAVRQSVYDNIDEYREIVEDPAFKQYFPVIGENHLKTAPKGFPKDFEYIDYLKCKDYTCAYMVPDAFFLAPDLLDKVEDVFKQLKRFADFTNFTIDDFE